MRGLKSNIAKIAGAAALAALPFLPYNAKAATPSLKVIDANIEAVMPEFKNLSEAEKVAQRSDYERQLLKRAFENPGEEITLDVLSYLKNKHEELCYELQDLGFRFPTETLGAPTLKAHYLDGSESFHKMAIPKGTVGGVAYENGRFGDVPDFKLDNLAYVELITDDDVNIMLRNQGDNKWDFNNKRLSKNQLETLGMGVFYAQVTDANCEDPKKAVAYNIPIALMNENQSTDYVSMENEFLDDIQRLKEEISIYQNLDGENQEVILRLQEQLKNTEKIFLERIEDLLKQTGGSITLQAHQEFSGNEDLLRGMSALYGITENVHLGLRYSNGEGGETKNPVHIYREPVPETGVGSTTDVFQENVYRRHALEAILQFDFNKNLSLDLHAGVQKNRTTENYKVQDEIFLATGSEPVTLSGSQDTYTNEKEKTGPLGGIGLSVGTENIKARIGANLAEDKKPGYEASLEFRLNWGGRKK